MHVCSHLVALLCGVLAGYDFRDGLAQLQAGTSLSGVLGWKLRLLVSHEFFKFFRETRVISLPKRADRRTEMSRELKHLGQSVDGKAVTWFDAISPSSAGGFPSVGARGCFLSHLEVQREAFKGGAEMLLVLEDDAHFGRAFRKHHSDVLGFLETNDWDIFYAGYRPRAAVPETGPVAFVEPDLPLETTHAMAFRRDAISKVIPYLEAILARPPGSPEGGPMHVDGAFNWLRKAHPELRTCISIPQIVTQRSSASDISPKSGFRSFASSAPGIRRLINRIR